MRSKTRNKSRFSACGLATVLLGASLTLAKSYDIACDTQSLARDVNDDAVPSLVGDTDMHGGHDDGVQVSYVLAPDGSADDSIVTDKT
ncbi:MAG: hypothetical protein QNJ05_00450 [Woeseiaceae bacterium]|nr:hypothetical protein [Woeseiaceae bacterium]